jgi:hypothetical protein
MADEQTPVPSDRAPQGSLQLVSPHDQRVYTVDGKAANFYRRQGWVEPSTAQVRSENILRTYEQSWKSKFAAPFEGVVSGVPGLSSVISKVAPQPVVHALAQDTAVNQAAHPYLFGAGQVAGGIGTAAALSTGLGAVAGAAGGALGLGAEAVGALGEGAAAAGAAGEVAGAAGAVGEAAAAGTEAVGAGAEATAANPAAQAALKAATQPSWAQTLKTAGGTIAENAAISGVFGLGQGADAAAMSHALDPSGQEHLSYTWKNALDNVVDGAETGALWGAAGALLAPAFKAASRSLSATAQRQLERGLFDTDKLNTAMRGAAKTPVMEQVRALGLTDVGMTAAKRMGNVDSAIKATEGRMNIFKMTNAADARLDPNIGAELSGQLGEILSGTPAGQAAARDFKTADLTFDQLQQFRRKWYDAADWARPDLPENQAYEQAGALVKKAMLGVLRDADVGGQGGLANEWGALDDRYHYLSIIKSSLKSTDKAAAAGWMSNILGNAVVTGAVAQGLTGSTKISGEAAALMGLYKSVQGFRQWATDTNLGNLNRSLSKTFDAASRRSTQAVAAGLYGYTGLQAPAASRLTYDKAAGPVSAWQQDRTGGLQNLRQSLAASNVPGLLADKMARQKAAQLDYLAQTKPSPPRVAPDIVTHSQPDMAAQYKWLGKVHTMQDPTYALAHPTESNMDVLRKFYPQMLQDTQDAVLQQVQNNPYLPLESKLWASKILGRPITPAATGRFFTVLTAARQQSAQAEAAPSRGGQNKGKPVQFEGTRLDALQNQGDG